MDTSTVLQQHQNWLDKVKKALVFNQDAARDVTLPITVKQQRIDELQRRIDDLDRQKSATTRRFDDAIAEHKSALSQLQAQLAADKSALQPPAVSQGPPAAPAADTKKRSRRRTPRE
jgi:predicted  nucleic acid-binding Zn-ribbon protein